MRVRATDVSIPLHHTQWVVWKETNSRLRLLEVSDIRARVALIARFDTRGVRSPKCIGQIPFAELTAADWELHHPDMIIWVWQAARKGSVKFRATQPIADFAHPLYFH